MIKALNLQLLTATIIFILSSNCRALSMSKGDIVAGLGITMNRLDLNQAPHLTSMPQIRENLGIGLSAQVFWQENGSVEVSLFYQETQFVREFAGSVLSETSNRFHIPILVKYSFLKYFSLGLGPYASYLSGEAKTLINPSPVPGLQSSASDSGEHGLEAALSLNFKITDYYFISTDYRHSYSLTPRADEERNYQTLYISIKKQVNL